MEWRHQGFSKIWIFKKLFLSFSLIVSFSFICKILTEILSDTVCYWLLIPDLRQKVKRWIRRNHEKFSILLPNILSFKIGQKIHIMSQCLHHKLMFLIFPMVFLGNITYIHSHHFLQSTTFLDKNSLEMRTHHTQSECSVIGELKIFCLFRVKTFAISINGVNTRVMKLIFVWDICTCSQVRLRILLHYFFVKTFHVVCSMKCVNST